MLSNIVEMHSGNTYFRWISMNFSIIYLILESNKNTFKWKCELDMFDSKMAKSNQNIKRFIQIKVLQWVHHILSIEACDAIRPEFNCFISMIISVDTLCGFAPLIKITFNHHFKKHIYMLLSWSFRLYGGHSFWEPLPLFLIVNVYVPTCYTLDARRPYSRLLSISS